MTHRLSHFIIIVCVLLAGSSCTDHPDPVPASGPTDLKIAPLPTQSTPQSRESFLTQFYSAHKKGDREAMNSLCRDNPSAAEWAMFQLGKLVAYFDDMNDHSALAGTEIGGEAVSPSELRAMVRDLESSIGAAADEIKAKAAEEYSSEKQTPEADAQLDAQEWDAYLESFGNVDDEQYDELLREFVLAYAKKDEAEIRRIVTPRTELIRPLLSDYFELLVAMAAHTNLEAVSFEWSGAVSWTVPMLFDEIAALAYYHSEVLQDPSSMFQMSISLEQVVSASMRAGERAEEAGRDAAAIDKYLHIVALAERFNIPDPDIKPKAFTKLSRLYYQLGDATKAHEFAEKARREAQ